MAATDFIHHIGTFLLLAATALLIVTDITAPVINNMGMLKVDTPFGDGSDQTQVSYGTFGWCILDDYSSGRDGMDLCTGKQVGYHPVDALDNITNTDFSAYADRTTAILSRVMVLHPIATGFAFIAFLLALSSGLLGSLLASLLACATFLTTLCALICDFILFSIIRSNVNNSDPVVVSGDDSEEQTLGEPHAYYSVGMWTTLISCICSLIATVVVFFACCSKGIKKRREHEKVRGGSASPPARRAHPRWMFWKRNRAPASTDY